MTGALLAVAGGSLSGERIAELLASGSTADTPVQRHCWRGWNVAEAKGLCLHRVWYDGYDSLV